MKTFLLKEKDLGFFPDWEDIFGRKAPIYLEIGMGNGEFSIWLAQNNPHTNVIGIDVSKEIIRKAERKVNKANLENLRIVRIEGAKALCKLFNPQSLMAVFMNFPDPWTKKSHKERRIINDAFCYLLGDRLEIEGYFIMATDSLDYANYTVEIFEKVEVFKSLWEKNIINDFPGYYKTKYARKWISMGLPIYYIGYKKMKTIEIPSWVKDFYPLLKLEKEEIIMPYIIVEIKEDPKIEEVLKILPKGIYERNNKIVNYLSFYSKENEILIDTVVVEGSLRQRFFISLYLNDHKLKISIHEATDPDPTYGVHESIAIIFSYLYKRFNELKILQNTCKKEIVEELLKQ
jgi:tRNA (guanine-N7-)-methyltransferase